MRDELKDRAISLLKDTYAIGYEDGVKATRVSASVVLEEKIDAIRSEIDNSRVKGHGVDVVSVDYVLSIIDKHCGGNTNE